MTANELFEKFIKRDENRMNKFNESPQDMDDIIIVLDGRIRDLVQLVHHLYNKEIEREENNAT